VALDGRSYQVIGVLPPGVRYPDADAELWIPIGWSFVTDPGLKTNRMFYAYGGIARLQPNVGLDRLRSDLAVVAGRIDAEQQANGGPNQRLQIDMRGGPGGGGGRGGAPRGMGPGGRLTTAFAATSLRESVVGDTTQPILVLAAAVGLVLLIA